MTRNANPLRPEQVQDLLDASPAAWRLAFALAAYAGLRAVEVCTLRWRQVDLGMRVIGVPTKTKSRNVPIVAALAALLPTEPKGGDERVCTAGGKPWTEAGLRQAFRQAQAEAGIGGYCFHDLRRFCLRRDGGPPRHTAYDLEALRAAIVRVEGPAWLELDALRAGDHNSVMGAIRRWCEVGRGVIDGLSLHRYFILAEGEVVYSEMHGRADLDKARAEGFRTEAEAAGPARAPAAKTRHVLLAESYRSLDRATETLVRYFEFAMPSCRLLGEHRQAVSSIAPDIVQAAVAAVAAEMVGQAEPRGAALAGIDLALAGMERRPLMYARTPEALELQVLRLVEQRQMLRGDIGFDVAAAFSVFVERLNGEPNSGPLFAILRDAAPLPPDAPPEGRIPEPRGVWKRGRLDELPRLLGDFGRWVEAGCLRSGS